ncbi:MAG: SurA N-terminal domain-containing protein [Deltaproteobacteria bacterium]|nr:SurA N-terminal domain-containing protein [Deltaproteobacteria bacterium]
MLKVLRKRKRSWVIFTVLGAIILVFIFWGIGSFRIDKSTIAARVNGKYITAIEYAKTYQQQMNYYRNIFKDQFNDELLEKMNLKQNTIQMLINTTLQLQEAKRQGIAASTEEVQKVIETVAVFQKDGVFNKEQYLQVLKANHILPGEYEQGVKDSLIIQKLHKNITDAIIIADKEIEDRFAGENKKVNLQYLTIDGARFEKNVSVTDEEAKTYFEKSKGALKELFKVPTKINAVYLSIPFKDYQPAVKISEAELKEYYEKNLNEFQTQKQVSARHILIRPATDKANNGPASGTSDIKKAKEEARKKAEEILSLARKGEGFAALAKKYSDDKASGSRGGSLGYFKQGEMVKPFEDAAFSLKKKELSAVLESEFGYHIIKVDDVKEARLIPFKEAKNTIEKNLKQAGAKKLALDIASEIQKAVASGKSEMKDEAVKRKLKVIETGLFSERDVKIELAGNTELKKTAFSMKAGEISSAVKTESGVYIIKVLDRKDEHAPTYEEAASSVKTALAKDKAKEKAKEAADAVFKRLKQGEDIQKVASKQGYVIGESGFFAKAQGIIPIINIDVEDKADIFSLSKGSPYYSQPVRQGDKFYILKFKQGQEAEQTEFAAKKNEIKNSLLKQKQQEALDKWLNEIRSKAKIEISPEAM